MDTNIGNYRDRSITWSKRARMQVDVNALCKCMARARTGDPDDCAAIRLIHEGGDVAKR